MAAVSLFQVNLYFCIVKFFALSIFICPFGREIDIERMRNENGSGDLV